MRGPGTSFARCSGRTGGREWYDSGIGFAIPLADIDQQLPRLRSGQDLFPGLLGITLKSANPMSAPAEIAAVQVKSPAQLAGLRAGDTIVEVEGRAIERQSQLKHALGPRNAGEPVRLVARRGNERIEAVATLIDKLVPYEHPFLGLLPLRDPAANPGGVVVRFVYPGSGAAAAGLQPGDRIQVARRSADAQRGIAARGGRQPRTGDHGETGRRS